MASSCLQPKKRLAPIGDIEKLRVGHTAIGGDENSALICPSLEIGRNLQLVIAADSQIRERRLDRSRQTYGRTEIVLIKFFDLIRGQSHVIDSDFRNRSVKELVVARISRDPYGRVGLHERSRRGKTAVEDSIYELRLICSIPHR